MELSKEFRERFVKTLQGKDYVLYGGLLELARQRGLKRIDTRVIQIPSQDNGMYGVVEAEIETDDGVFKEIGDASPENVNRAIQPHLLRMAATRAKARAMRDAVGIDMVALEELGDAILPDEAAIPENPEDLVLTFGKYIRKSLGQVVRQDPGYVAWLAENARDEEIKQAARSVLGQVAAESHEFPEVSIEQPPAH
ncbi:MAG: hypothetical protein QM391_00190 [Bacillota bacterium]|jgi:hypothetical protein|nr:hypothetical protein [Bacillota bacterium]MDI9414463.1 hypothetical protein [Bacillota bacterium]NLD12661.1 hypothetical protein [Bacillota bacterium]HCD41973.1 hypothetical protein [Bacillota bacterium]HOB89099.1 hypothetical protein [Bacillota bacterium]